MKKVVLIALVMTVLLSHQPNLVSQARVHGENPPVNNETKLTDSLEQVIRQIDSLSSANREGLMQLQDQQLEILID